MDYYQVLRVPPNASIQEIEQAYRKLVKESRYDTTIVLKDVENAYRVLSNKTTKTVYDAKQGWIPPVERKKKKKKPPLLETLSNLTLRQLVTMLIIVSVVATIFFSVRFGYKLKSFGVGDVVFDNETGKKLGVIVETRDDYLFTDVRADAYLIENEAKVRTWYPEHTIKLHCHKRGIRQ